MTEFDMDKAKMLFGERIMNALEDEGCDTNKKKADFLGVSVDIIENYKKGKNFPPIGQLVRYAQLLNCSVDYLTNESVKLKTPDTSVKTVAIATGLSEESAKLLVRMKRAYIPQLAALDALLFSCLPRDPITGKISYAGVGGVIASNAEYFRIVNEFEKKLLEDGYGVEDPTARNVARMNVMDSTMNLLENGARAAELCSVYRENIKRLESEQNKKGGLDNGKRTSED